MIDDRPETGFLRQRVEPRTGVKRHKIMTMQMRAALLVLTGLIAVGTGLSTGFAADDPLARIVPPQDGARACYRRVYDSAHLKRNPRQQTTDIMLSSRQHGNGDKGIRVERIALTRRGQQSFLYIMMTCQWSKTANTNTSNMPIIKNARIQPGYDCIVVSSPSSAEEGGYALMQLPPDGKSLTLHLQSPIAVMKGNDKRGFWGDVDLRQDDRTFRLTRTETAACEGLEAALPNLP